MATAALYQEAVSSTYEDFDGLISATVTQFVKRHGGDWEELRGVANLIFLDAYEHHDREQESFEQWLVYKVWCGLLDRLKKDIRRHRRLPRVDLDTVTCVAPNEFHLIDLIDELSQDAKTVVRLTLDGPPHFHEILDTERRKRQVPRKFRHSAREMLKSHLRNLGWTLRRIDESFREIANVLSQS